MTHTGGGDNAFDLGAPELDSLRALLERRGWPTEVPLRAPEPDSGGESDSWDGRGQLVFFEASRFREIERDLLGELVTSFLAAVHSRGADIALWISSDGDRIRFRFGMATPDRKRGPAQFLRRMLAGFYKGAEVVALPVHSADKEFTRLARNEVGRIILGIPSERADTAVETRLDEALEAVADCQFDILVRLAPPDGAGRTLDTVEGELARFANSARQVGSMTVKLDDSEQKQGRTASVESDGESRQADLSRVSSNGRQSRAKSRRPSGETSGRLEGPKAPAGATAGQRLVHVRAGEYRKSVATIPSVDGDSSRSSEETLRATQQWQQQWGGTRSTEQAQVNTSSRQLAQQAQRFGRQAQLLQELVDEQLGRIRVARALGAFETTVVVASKKADDVELVSHALVGALRGDLTYLEPLRTVPIAAGDVGSVLKGLVSNSPPKWNLAAGGLADLSTAPSTLLTAVEAALWVRPPSHPILGVSVRTNARFGRVAPAPPANADDSPVVIGNLLADGRTASTVALHRSTLNRHLFIGGTTGAGKTTTIRTILSQLCEGSPAVPFLLIEPAKSEYRDLFKELQSQNKHPLRLVVGEAKGEHERSLRLNPFRPVPGLPIGRAVDQLKILLSSCFDMQASMPQLLEALIYDGFKEMRLDLAKEMPEGRVAVPSFSFLLGKGHYQSHLGKTKTLLDKVIERLNYSAEVRDSLRAAILVRLESFTIGARGRLFDTTREMDWDEILTRPCFVELSDIADPLVRRFLVGALVLRLYMKREAEARETGMRDTPFRHLVVLEEAHHLLREPLGSSPGAELVRQSNEILTDALAELRSYGQGFLIADQAPASLASSVLRNTATKIAHTLYFQDDCRAISDAMGIAEKNRGELRRLQPGECILFTPGLDEPIACAVRRK